MRIADEQFWSQVERNAPGACWPWIGKTIKGGYGDLRVRVDGRWAHVIAHRWAWEEVNGPIPVGFFVLHRCDNPPCVNPAHLFLGTHQDNMDDMARKGRKWVPRGEDCLFARLTEAHVREVRRLVRDKRLSPGEVAQRFGISASHVSDIVAGRAWAHVPAAPAAPVATLVTAPPGTREYYEQLARAARLAQREAARAGRAVSTRKLGTTPGVSAAVNHGVNSPRQPGRGRRTITRGRAGQS